MSLDGVFIHYLVDELKEALLGGKISKIYHPTPLTIIVNIRNHGVNHQLLISSELSAPRMHLTTEKSEYPEQPSGFCMLLRKYLERGIISNISQHDNDRLIIMKIHTTSELGDTNYSHLMIELMGRKSNIILIDEKGMIIDAIRKLPPTENQRSIIPKAIYLYPLKFKTLNPFDNQINDYEKLIKIDNLEGCSPLIQNEFRYMQSVNQVLLRPIQPVIITQDQKQFFYVFDLKYLSGIRQYYQSLSELLDTYHQKELKSHRVDYNLIAKLLKRELNRSQNKLIKLKLELRHALDETQNEHLALLLQSNLYLVKPGMGAITVLDFYHDNSPITITLNPLLSPSKNLKLYFNKLRKAKNAISHINEQITLTNNEIDYLDTLLTQIMFVNQQELLEIKLELKQYGYLKDNKRQKINNKKSIETYNVNNSQILVGKNNQQNNYLTHTLAHKDDYWFHVKEAPGAHIIVKTPQLTDDLIRLASNLAALYSKMHLSSSVPVDYTKVKYLKKIPGLKGFNVSYTNQKTIYINPNPNILNR